jgi:hypothetical protein
MLRVVAATAKAALKELPFVILQGEGRFGTNEWFIAT